MEGAGGGVGGERERERGERKRRESIGTRSAKGKLRGRPRGVAAKRKRIFPPKVDSSSCPPDLVSGTLC